MTGIFSKNGVSLERLQTLAEVVQAGSYSMAAKDDPTRATLISRQMGELEEALGIALFDKSKKPYQPTSAALRLAASSERFVREAYVANSLEHPGAVRVLDDDVADDGSPCLVMVMCSPSATRSRRLASFVLASYAPIFGIASPVPTSRRPV